MPQASTAVWLHTHADARLARELGVLWSAHFRNRASKPAALDKLTSAVSGSPASILFCCSLWKLVSVL